MEERLSEFTTAKLELELIQTQMALKPILRAEVYAHAMRASQNRKKDVRSKENKVDVSILHCFFSTISSGPSASVLVSKGAPTLAQQLIAFQHQKQNIANNRQLGIPSLKPSCSLCGPASASRKGLTNSDDLTFMRIH